MSRDTCSRCPETRHCPRTLPGALAGWIPGSREMARGGPTARVLQAFRSISARASPVRSGLRDGEEAGGMAATRESVGANEVEPRRAQRISATDAAALVRSGDWVEYGTGIGQPDAFDTALAQRVDELEDVKIRACLTLRPRAVLEADPGRDHFHWFNWHYTGYDRAKGDAGLATYIPCNLGEIPDYYRRFIDPPDIAVLKTCPKDEHGFFNFSLAALWHRAIVERAKVVIVEESAGLPAPGRNRERRARERGRLRDRGRRQPRPRDPEPAPHGRRPCRRAADRGRDRGRQLPADRHRSDAERGLLAAARERRSRPGRAHRDAHRRHRRPLPRRRRHRGPQDALSRQGRLHLRGRDADTVRDGRSQPGLPLPRCRPGQPAAHRDAERPRGRDQQHHADGPAGPGSQRVRRPPPHQRHGRAVAVRARRLRLDGGKSFICMSSTYERRGDARAASSST